MDYATTVMTISDGVSAGEREDGSGDAAESFLRDNGFEDVERLLVPDERGRISDSLEDCASRDRVLVVTTGGTGLGPRDVTPEATREVIDREAPGLAELMRSAGIQKTPMAALSRGIVGTVGATLVVNLPGSPKAVKESLEALMPVLPHALETLCGKTQHG